MTWDDFKPTSGRVVDDKYETHQVLGTGGMGAVWKARHRFTGRWVALKLLHPHVARSQRFSERFLREAQAAAQLRHPRVVDVLDAGREASGALYIAFELLEGEDLNDRAQQRRLDVKEAALIGIQALDGLRAAHEAGLIHRDVKPANIFLQRDVDVSVKLVDFGIAVQMEPDLDRDRNRLTKAGMVMGTPVFMSPEQMCADPLDGRTDFWSLAVSLYYGLALELPFRNSELQPLLMEVLQDRAKPIRQARPDLPPAVEAFFSRALAASLDDRFPDANEMSAALQSWLDPGPGPHEEQTEQGHGTGPSFAEANTEQKAIHPGLMALAELEDEVRRLTTSDTRPTGHWPLARRPGSADRTR